MINLPQLFLRAVARTPPLFLFEKQHNIFPRKICCPSVILRPQAHTYFEMQYNPEIGPPSHEAADGNRPVALGDVDLQLIEKLKNCEIEKPCVIARHQSAFSTSSDGKIELLDKGKAQSGEQIVSQEAKIEFMDKRKAQSGEQNVSQEGEGKIELFDKGKAQSGEQNVSKNAEEGDFLDIPFEEDQLKEASTSAQCTLVLGMGGGCDVFSAYALAQKVYGDFEGPPGHILYGNCISERVLPSDHPVLIENALYSVPGTRRKLEVGDQTYGTTLLEQSVPRGAQNSPLLFVFKSHKKVETQEQADEQTAENERRLHASLDSLGVDLVLAADTGGDSLTGGKDWQFSKLTGRDQQVLSALRKYQEKNSNFRFIHIVLGPGCDAETPEEEMKRQVLSGTTDEDLPWCRGRKYLGCFSMEDIIPECFKMVRTLTPNRTPFLMYRALMNTRKYHLDRPEGTNRDVVKIERHSNAEVVPREWLYYGLAFEYEDGPK